VPQQRHRLAHEAPLAFGIEALVEHQPDEASQPRQHVLRGAARVDQHHARDGA